MYLIRRKSLGHKQLLSKSIFRGGNCSPSTEVILSFLIGNVAYVQNISINLITICHNATDSNTN